MSSYPLYYGQQIILQANAYGAGLLGVTTQVGLCGSNNNALVPDIYTTTYGTTLFAQGEPFVILNSAGQLPTGGLQPVSYNDTVTFQQASTGKFWTIVPHCENDEGIALGISGATTATYTLVPQNPSDAGPMPAALVSAPLAVANNAVYLESTQNPGSYVFSDPDGNGVLLGSDTKTYFQIFLVSAPPTPAPSPTPPPPTPCTTSANCPSDYTCIKNVCEPNCITDADCPSNTICTYGVCTIPGCAQNSDCPANYTCQGNTCIPISGCVTSATCNQGWTCQNNICVPPTPQCSTNAQCKFGQSCNNGVCELNFVYPAIFGGGFLLIIIIFIVLFRVTKK